VSIKQYLADCVQVATQDSNELFNRLMKESYGDKPGRVFECVPCSVSIHNTKLPVVLNHDVLQTFGFGLGHFYYTNARELLNWGWSWNEVLGVIDFTDYRAVMVVAPYFIYSQFSTSNQITSIPSRNQHTTAGLGYWMPPEVEEHLSALGYDAEDQWNVIVETYSPSKLRSYMRRKGVMRREVFALGSDMLAYKAFALYGDTCNPNAWPHFIAKGVRDPQAEIAYTVELIKEEIEK
jgi:hypothetical protein